MINVFPPSFLKVEQIKQCVVCVFTGECNVPLGISNGSIPDEALTASSSHDVIVGPHNARLVTGDFIFPLYTPTGKSSEKICNRLHPVTTTHGSRILTETIPCRQMMIHIKEIVFLFFETMVFWNRRVNLRSSDGVI